MAESNSSCPLQHSKTVSCFLQTLQFLKYEYFAVVIKTLERIGYKNVTVGVDALSCCQFPIIDR